MVSYSAVGTEEPGGPCPSKRLLALPPFRFTQNTFMKHHVMTPQQAIMEKDIITFEDKSRLTFSRF